MLWLAATFLLAGYAGAQESGAAELAGECTACHGEDGNATLEGFPSLAGQPEYWLLDQLILMKVGVREVPQMAALVETLSEDDFAALAAHYSAMEAELTGPEPDASLVEAGASIADSRRCASCHGAELTGREAIPRVAKQRIDYLTGALTAYRDGTRRSADTNMTAAVRGLSDEDLTALAHYAAAQ